MSWRDDTAQAIQDDLDLLADEALSAAQHLLEKSGEFYPFAVNLSKVGRSRPPSWRRSRPTPVASTSTSTRRNTRR